MKSAAGGMPAGRWMWVAPFAAGILVSLIGQFAFQAKTDRDVRRGGPNSAEASSASRAKPWGDLEIAPLILERPDETYENFTQAREVRWFFPGYSAVQLTEFLESCALEDRLKTLLLDTNRWRLESNGSRILPPAEAIRELSAPARERIYAVLARSPENAQHYPFVHPEQRYNELLDTCDLPPDQVALVRQLSYRVGGKICFSDGQLFEHVTSSNEARRLFKVLLQVPTMIVRLRLSEDSNVDQLLDYWNGQERSRELRPLLRSLAKTPGGASINISYLLPTVPRMRLYTFPPLTNHLSLDCFWSSFNFFDTEQDYRVGDGESANRLLQRDYVQVHGERRFGDLMILSESGTAMHACVYIADDIYYTKNGTDRNQPWVFMRMADMMGLYDSVRPQEWRVFRKRSNNH